MNLHSLIESCPPLDLNSIYYYYILCRDFSKSCVIAEEENSIAGFISGYLKPEDPSILFIWQVAVSEKFRGKGIAVQMLQWLTEQPFCKQTTVMETTVSPSNISSASIFNKFALTKNTGIEKLSFLGTENFYGTDHEEEILYKIKLKRNYL